MLSQVNSSDKDELVNITTPGAQLREARERLNKSTRDVAEHLCLSTQFIDSLEQDHYEDLPGEVFIRGYLRNYAAFVGLNPNEVVELFDRLGFVDKDKTPQQVRLELQQQPITTNDGVVRTVTYLIILSLLVLVFLWWHSQNSLNGNLVSTNDATPNSITPVPVTTTDAMQQQQAVSPTAAPAGGMPTNPNEATSVMSNIPVPPPATNQPGVPGAPASPEGANNTAAAVGSAAATPAPNAVQSPANPSGLNAAGPGEQSVVTSSPNSAKPSDSAASNSANEDATTSDSQDNDEDSSASRHAKHRHHYDDDAELDTSYD